MEKDSKGRTRCPKEWFNSHALTSHKCPGQRSNPTSSTSAQSFVHNDGCNKNKNDLQCTHCDLQSETPKLLDIHIRNCKFRNTCKHCGSPKNSVGQCCAKCVKSKEKNQEYDLRIKPASQAENSTINSSRPNAASERPIKISYSASANFTVAKNSLTYSRKRIAMMTDPQMQKRLKVKLKVNEHQLNARQIQSASTQIQNQVEIKQSRVVLHQSDKFHRNSGKNIVQQKKEFTVANGKVSFEKCRTNNSQKPNFKNSRQIDEKRKPIQVHRDLMPDKRNSTNKMVNVQFLLNIIPKNDCAVLLQSSDHFYKCCRCGKTLRSIKSGVQHYKNCKSTKLLNTEVSDSSIKYVCTICHTSFVNAPKLINHLKGCNIFTKNYERACEKRCKKCNFRCISSILFEKHDCDKEREYMIKCKLSLKKTCYENVRRVLVRECKICSKVIDEEIVNRHFQLRHPGVPMLGIYKEYYVNINHGPSEETVVVKSEPVSPEDDYPDKNKYPSSNAASVNMSARPLSTISPINEYPSNAAFNNMSAQPPSTSSPVNEYSSNTAFNNMSARPPSISSPINEYPSSNATSVNMSARPLSISSPLSLSTASWYAKQYSFLQPSSSHSALNKASVFNLQMCKCINHNVNTDVKPCLKCLKRLSKKSKDIVKLANLIPIGLIDIKEELPESLEDLNCDSLANGSTPAHSSQSGEVTDGDSRNLYVSLDDYQLTPPSSHNGISPPSTPNALAQSLTNREPCSVSDVSIDDDLSLVPDINHLEKQPLPNELVEYINDDCSPDMPLMDNFPPVDNIVYKWEVDIDDFNSIDACAVVSSTDVETVEKYFCYECLSTSFLDTDSLLKHFCEFHETVKDQYLVMYVLKNSDTQCFDQKS